MNKNGEKENNSLDLLLCKKVPDRGVELFSYVPAMYLLHERSGYNHKRQNGRIEQSSLIEVSERTIALTETINDLHKQCISSSICGEASN
jgi:hypothetical protein